MGIELSYRQDPNYIIVKVSGKWTANDAMRAIEEMHDEAVRRGLTRLLVDALGLSKPDTEMTRFFTGEHWAKLVGYRFRSAVLARPEVYNGFAEVVALNRSSDIKVFFDEEKALDWLMNESN